MTRSAPAGAAVRVRVPATSANLGPGFDALALALALHDEVVVRRQEGGLAVEVAGGQGADVPRDGSNLLVRSLRRGLEHLGEDPEAGLGVSCTLQVPHARGLGSSAGAVVAGLLAARALVPAGRSRMPDPVLLALAAELEGHPDNVAACLLGGLALAWSDPPGWAPAGAGPGARVHALRREPAAELAATVYVPEARASTAQARSLLPAQVPHADAARNAARSALLLEAVTHRPDLLHAATEDALHQRYRAPAMPESIALVDRLRADGHAAVLSGAGPSVLVFGRVGRPHGMPAPPGWQALTLPVDRDGARVRPDTVTRAGPGTAV